MKQETRTARIDARLPESVRGIIERAALLQGRTLSEFVVSSAREAAEEAISQHETLRLKDADRERFIESLMNPPEVAPAMHRAAERHADLIEPS
ncbi:MAG: DUF1778 domain-containing protein [Fuerstiella sp.]